MIESDVFLCLLVIFKLKLWNKIGAKEGVIKRKERIEASGMQTRALVDGLLQSNIQYINKIITTYWQHFRKYFDRYELKQGRNKSYITYTCNALQFTVVGIKSSNCAVRIQQKYT